MEARTLENMHHPSIQTDDRANLTKPRLCFSHLKASSTMITGSVGSPNPSSASISAAVNRSRAAALKAGPHVMSWIVYSWSGCTQVKGGYPSGQHTLLKRLHVCMIRGLGFFVPPNSGIVANTNRLGAARLRWKQQRMGSETV